MFQLIAAAIVQFALQNPVSYLEEKGFEHITVEGTRFTAWNGNQWCKGRVVGSSHVNTCSNQVVPKCDGFDHPSCLDRARRLARTDLAAAIETFERACANGDTSLCVGFDSSELTEQQLRAQVPAMWMGCGRKDGNSCGNLANLALRLGSEKQGMALAERGCDYGAKAVCRFLDQRAADAAANKIAAR